MAGGGGCRRGESDRQPKQRRHAAVRCPIFHSWPIEDSEAWQQFKARCFRGRPAITMELLDAARKVFQAEHQHRLLPRAPAAPTREAVAENIEELSDDQISNLLNT